MSAPPPGPSASTGRSLRILVDTNVVLDVILAREPWAGEARPVYAARDAGQVELLVLASTLTDVYYIARKQVGRDRAHTSVRECVRVYTILPLTRELVERALTRNSGGFEDDVQMVAAEVERLDYLMTRDTQDFSGSPVPALTPAEIAALVATP
jgi:predicted nucleic acid-binding protein